MVDLRHLSYRELVSLIQAIDEQLPRAEQKQIEESIPVLVREALEVVDELRRLSGRDYQLTLRGRPIKRRDY
jgi:hypothetical protein